MNGRYRLPYGRGSVNAGEDAVPILSRAREQAVFEDTDAPA
jgi:hypothetical protein